MHWKRNKDFFRILITKVQNLVKRQKKVTWGLLLVLAGSFARFWSFYKNEHHSATKTQSTKINHEETKIEERFLKKNHVVKISRHFINRSQELLEHPRNTQILLKFGYKVKISEKKFFNPHAVGMDPWIP